MRPNGPVAWGPGDFVGAALCLDFANTVSGHDKDRSRHWFADYGLLVAWSLDVGCIDGSEARNLRRRAREAPESAKAALARVIAVRECLYRIFSALSAGGAPDDVDMARFNRALAKALPHGSIARQREGFDWRWAGTADDLDRPLWPVLRSAAELLTGPDLDLLRECGRCSWLFLDRSKNRRRRWCKMSVCGNRAKAARHYRRKSAAADSAS